MVVVLFNAKPEDMVEAGPPPRLNPPDEVAVGAPVENPVDAVVAVVAAVACPMPNPEARD